MDDIPLDLVSTLKVLLPGFLTSTIFYWLAEVPKPSHAERIVQALIVTSLIQILISLTKILALSVGKHIDFGPWSETATVILSILLSTALGVWLAYLSNHDKLYEIARNKKLTTKTSQDDFILIVKELGDAGVIVHLNDGNRLCGYISSYPANRETGIFHIKNPAWVIGSERQPQKNVDSIIVNGRDVKYIEFLIGEKNAQPQ
ncbi:DUF6338 family protein [Pseudomonas sp. NUPR-001]|uniref:DUF6338 family protein n=1 Tax=Pseudomonas sp. NUPR-001 TaxID=3416058 RepID=UPI003F9B3F06